MTLQDEIALTRKAIKHAELQVDQLKERLDFLLVAEQGQKFPTCTTCKGTMYCDKGDWRCAACGGLGYTIKDV